MIARRFTSPPNPLAPAQCPEPPLTAWAQLGLPALTPWPWLNEELLELEVALEVAVGDAAALLLPDGVLVLAADVLGAEVVAAVACAPVARVMAMAPIAPALLNAAAVVARRRRRSAASRSAGVDRERGECMGGTSSSRSAPRVPLCEPPLHRFCQRAGSFV